MGAKIALPSFYISILYSFLPYSWLLIHGAYATHLLGVPHWHSLGPRGDLRPAGPSHQASCTCCMSPDPQSFTAHHRGVDSRGWAAAAAGDEDPVGVRRVCMGTP